MNGRRPAALLAAAALLMGVASPAQAQTSLAQDYPNRP